MRARKGGANVVPISRHGLKRVIGRQLRGSPAGSLHRRGVRTSRQIAFCLIAGVTRTRERNHRINAKCQRALLSHPTVSRAPVSRSAWRDEQMKPPTIRQFARRRSGLCVTAICVGQSQVSWKLTDPMPTHIPTNFSDASNDQQPDTRCPGQNCPIIAKPLLSGRTFVDGRGLGWTGLWWRMQSHSNSSPHANSCKQGK
jgi:hypothetical protein